MRFSKYLNKHKTAEFSSNYVDYTFFEQLIKDADFKEETFISSLDLELKRVFDFVTARSNDLLQTSSDLEYEAKKLFLLSSPAEEKAMRSTYVAPAELEDIKKEKKLLQKKIEKLKKNVRLLSEFIRLNVVAFNKILKKHDRNTNFVIRPMYKIKLREKFHEIDALDNLLYRISKIVLTSNEEIKDKDNKISTHTFIRKTNKYWVHKENITALKCAILNHLPIYVHTTSNKKDKNPAAKIKSSKKKHDKFNNNISGNSTNYNSDDVGKDISSISHEDSICSPYHNWDHKSHDTCISSVYLDNSKFELYHGRLKKDQGAEAIRIRWYGKKVTKEVFVERKRHEEDWTGEESMKLRFKIPENLVTDFLNGKDIWHEVSKINKDNREETRHLYNEVQKSIIEKNLRPVTRTFYKRTAFQLPNSSKVRLSLDTNLCMIKECLNGNFNASINNWRRKDVDCEYPFYKLSDADIVRFPYAILEIKLQSMHGEKPQWIEDLLSSNLIEHVDKFSKFIHGTSILYPQIQTIPYWLPQMNAEIRKEYKNGTGNMKFDRCGKIVVDVHKKNAKISEDYTTANEGEFPSETSKGIQIDVEDKRIAIPVRVEPKVFFANERTFLSWLHFSIFIGGIGTAMMGLGDTKAVYSGMVFIGTSILFAIYALYLYFWRAGMIRIRDPGPYDDLYGPAFLVVVFLAAMILSVLFKFPLH
ncbi:hypothetical protein EDEG_01883 [Edhazardia aedis USNM 41457]|uniref:SPX domain-containing protein n=1 Tax=Edhazardia aedis (strain USNM 41457) TaxID=1003232 RepID=J9DMK0_EDHAE|nr:hypothetical protein EDEG_01883 [Edhazardia aedis USNM 41457]|eukprot:EJW03825.1 hypothetical protein EDEG_01883 [Edhazardia aedis USNM 41457]